MTQAMIKVNYKKIIIEQDLATGMDTVVEKNYRGAIVPVVKDFGQFVALDLDGVEVDFGKSEIELNPIDYLGDLRNIFGSASGILSWGFIRR